MNSIESFQRFFVGVCFANMAVALWSVGLMPGYDSPVDAFRRAWFSSFTAATRGESPD